MQPKIQNTMKRLIYDTINDPIQFSNGMEATNTVYSDRLFQWDSKKHDEFCQKHFGNTGQYWDRREPDKIQEFLSDYLNEKVILCKIEQHTNASNGYPLWRFDYRKSDAG